MAATMTSVETVRNQSGSFPKLRQAAPPEYRRFPGLLKGREVLVSEFWSPSGGVKWRGRQVARIDVKPSFSGQGIVLRMAPAMAAMLVAGLAARRRMWDKCGAGRCGRAPRMRRQA